MSDSIAKRMELCIDFRLPQNLIKLSQLENFVPLSELREGNGFSKKLYIEKFKIESKENNIQGLYAFWFTGKELPDNKRVKIKIREEQKTVEIEWNKSDFFIHQPLYIGKTTNFVQRITQHLLATKKNWKESFVKKDFKDNRLNKLNTSCQFRAGFEHLFDGRKNLDYCFENVSLSFVEIENANNGIKERFYLEDLAIGVFRPWFNVDSER